MKSAKAKCILNKRLNIEFLFVKKFYGKCVTYIKCLLTVAIHHGGHINITLAKLKIQIH